MELTKLRYFYEVAKLGHVTKAAEKIHIAQPALTKAIKQLEEELGVPLFYKRGRNVYLTTYGEYLRDKLEGILPAVDGIYQEIEGLKGERAHTIKLNVLAASTVVTDAVIRYKKKNPSAIFQLIQNETETDCDVSVSMDGADVLALPPYVKNRQFNEKIYLAVPKTSPYAQKESVRLDEVADEGFVHLAGSKLFRAACDRFCTAAGVKAHLAFESDSIVAVRNLIGAGAGVGFWPQYSWGRTLSDVTLVPIAYPDCRRIITVGLHEGAELSRLAPDFYGYLVRFLSQRANVEK